MSFPGKLAPFPPLGGIPRGSRLHKAANIPLLRLCHTWTESAAPLAGRRVVFAGIRFLCRAGPMCPAEKCVPGGGARGPRPTGQVRYPPVGDGVPTSRQRGSAALGDGFPRQCVPQGHLLRGAHWLGMTERWAAGHMGPALRGRCVEPPAGYAIPAVPLTSPLSSRTGSPPR